MTRNLFLGDKENRLLLTLEENQITVFRFKDAKKILQTNDSSVKHILNGLVEKNRIKRIEYGKYLLIPARAGYKRKWIEEPWTVIPFLVDEYYIGFWTAMNYWEMTEQIPNTVFVVLTKRKRNLKFGYQKLQFVTLSKKKFFGFKKVNNLTNFNISTKEKTIVDALMYPQYCGKISEVAKAIWNSKNEIDWRIVFEMAKKIEVGVVLRRLGYLLTILDIKEDTIQEIEAQIKSEQFKGYHYLDPTGPKKRLDYSKDYKLIINRTKQELLGWMEY